MKKKKIVQVVPAFNVGGAEMLVKEYLLNIDRTQFHVEVLALGGRKDSVIERELESKGIKVSYLSEMYHVSDKLPGIIRKFLVAYKWRAAMNKYFKNTKANCIHCHLSVANKIIVARSKFKNAKVFYTVHSDPDKYWANGNNIKEQKAISRLIEKNNMVFISLHEEQTGKIRKYFGKKCEIHLLNNAVDIPKYAPTLEKRQHMREQLGIAENAFVIGHVGRFLPVKNHEFLVETFRFVKQKRPDAVLCLVGDGELRENIEAQVNDLLPDGSVLFLGNRGDVPQIMSAFDAFVLPSVWEGFPMTIIEAQAARLPCFVSDAVNSDVRITSLVSFLKLGDGTKKWAESILTSDLVEYEDICLSKYDIRAVVSELQKMYVE